MSGYTFTSPDGKTWETGRESPGGQQAGGPRVCFRCPDASVLSMWRSWRVWQDRSLHHLKKTVEAGDFAELQRWSDALDPETVVG